VEMTIMLQFLIFLRSFKGWADLITLKTMKNK